MDFIWIVVLILVGGLLLSFIISLFRVNRSFSARKNPDVQAFCAMIECYGYYDQTAQSEERANKFFHDINTYENDSSNDIQQRKLFWKLLKKYGNSLPIMLAGTFAVAYYSDITLFGMSNNTPTIKIFGESLPKLYPILGMIANDERLSFELFNKTLLLLMPGILLFLFDTFSSKLSERENQILNT
ncbi:MAG: hypothetical protein RR547_05960 [Raoultibacter sp.]